MAEFVKFVEYNDHEGETWTFWLQLDGNKDQLDELYELIEQYEDAQGSESEYRLDTEVRLREDQVDVLVEHGGGGYMDSHNKVVGTLVVPADLLADSEYGKNLDDLYKGGITKLFTAA
jgi:hypothetical protein